jgi:ATP-dependent RNA helicase DDX3X
LKAFSDLDLHPQLKKNLNEMGFDQMTPIQRAVIPYVVDSHDIIGCAQTGSGKTVSFLAPIVNKMLNDGPPESDKNLSKGVSAPIALILTPTRELAEQIFKEARKVLHKTGMMVAKVYGGVAIEQQLRCISNGIDILVATPGRLIDFMKRHMITLSSVKYLVFDEADRMLEMGFEDQLNEIIFKRDITKKENRINMMFSATFTSQVRSIARDFMNEFYFFTSNLDEENNANENIEQSLIYCEDNDKILKLHEILQTLKGSIISILTF